MGMAQLRSIHQADALKFREIEDLQDASRQLEETAIAEKAYDPIHMHWSKSDSLCDMLLAQWKGITLITDHASDRNLFHEVQKQIGNALFCRALAERSQQLIRVIDFANARF